MRMFNVVNPLKWLVAAFRAVYLRDVPVTVKPVSTALVYISTLIVVLMALAGVAMESHTPIGARVRIWWRRRWDKKHN